MEYTVVEEDNSKKWIGYFKCKNCGKIYAFYFSKLDYIRRLLISNPCDCANDPDINMIMDFIGYKKNPNYKPENEI